MNTSESPCHFCDRRVVGCHSTCEDYKKYCDEIAKIHQLKLADQEKDAQIKGYEQQKKKRIKK